MKLLAGSILFAGLVFAQGNTNDTRFVNEAAVDDMAQMQMGQLAVQNGTNDQVKALGQKLVDDHSKLDDQLKGLAAKDNFTLPMGLSVRAKAEVNRFTNMTAGTTFDRDFLRQEIRDHESDIARFNSEAANGNNQDLKNYASKALPVLKDHLAKAQAAQSAVGMTSKR